MEYTGKNQIRQEESHSTHRFRRLFLDLLQMGWGGCDSANPPCSSPNTIT